MIGPVEENLLRNKSSQIQVQVQEQKCLGPLRRTCTAKKQFTDKNTNTDTNTIGARRGNPAVRQLLRNTNTKNK